MLKTVKKELDFATATVGELRQYLDKLKKAEAKLEIALTLRKYPEVELSLIRLTAMTIELSNLEKLIKFEAAGTAEEIEAKKKETEFQINALESRLVNLVGTNPDAVKLRNMYCERVTALRESMSTVGLSKKVLKYREHYLDILSKLGKACNEFVADKTLPEGFNAYNEIPKLLYYKNTAEKEFGAVPTGVK